jgi:small-conductance mechanosensitive channel
MSMPRSLRPIRSTLAVLALCACGVFGGDAPEGGPADAEAVVDSAPDTTGALEPEAAEPADATAPEAAPDQAQTVEERLDRILESQEAINRRLDSLTAAASPTDSASGIAGSGQVLGQARESVRNFGVAVVWSILAIALFNFAIRLTVWVLDALAERNASRRLFYKRIVPIARIVLWTFAAYLIVAVIFRVDAQGLFAAAAAIGVAVGFAAQDLIKNLFGGLILVFDQPFQVGDKIRIGDTYGEVKSIGLRSTRIVTPDDSLVTVPNAQVVDQHVANANSGELNCQVVTDLYLPNWPEENLVKRIAFDAAASSKYVYLNKPIVVLVADEFKERLMTRVRVKAYVLDPRLEFLFQSDVTERARAGFREAGLLQPYAVTISGSDSAADD